MIFSREQTLARLRQRIEAGVPIIGGGAGTGISAKFEEVGGIDLIVIYNSGRYRMAGPGSLAGLMPYGDANPFLIEIARAVLTVVEDSPVLAGVCASDPFRLIGKFLDEVKAAGFSGIQNFPTVGLIDGQFRANLEETGMGFNNEVELIRLAHERDLLTTPYVFDVDQAQQMVAAGADVLVAHVGLTTKGTIGAHTGRSLDECVRDIQAIGDAARSARSDIIILCHGGPIANPEDAQYVLARTRGIHGFYGASSMERLPVEHAITDQVRQFK